MSNKTIFVDVDTGKDFMDDGVYNSDGYAGKLQIPHASSIRPNLSYLTQMARERGITRLLLRDLHDEDSKEISESPDFVNTFPPHTMRGTMGADSIPETRPFDPYEIDWKDAEFSAVSVRSSDEVILYKDHFDAFEGNPHTRATLDVLRPSRAIVYGVATNVCVDYAVMGLLERNVEVYAVTDAMKELPQIPSPFEKWKARGARLITTREVSDLL
jgi:nicotinamidase/pyrazinamidase